MPFTGINHGRSTPHANASRTRRRDTPGPPLHEFDRTDRQEQAPGSSARRFRSQGRSVLRARKQDLDLWRPPRAPSPEGNQHTRLATIAYKKRVRLRPQRSTTAEI